MRINFNVASCQSQSPRHRFGLCDDPHPAQNPAYIDEHDGKKWIAVVENYDRHSVTFTAVDHCIDLQRSDGKMAQRCDGFLAFETTIIFVELKQRTGGNSWVKDAEEQLRTTITFFEDTELAEDLTVKKAFIANSDRPKFRASQTVRMDQFLKDTGYVLRIENRIVLG